MLIVFLQSLSIKFLVFTLIGKTPTKIYLKLRILTSSKCSADLRLTERSEPSQASLVQFNFLVRSFFLI